MADLRSDHPAPFDAERDPDAADDGWDNFERRPRHSSMRVPMPPTRARVVAALCGVAVLIAGVVALTFVHRSAPGPVTAATPGGPPARQAAAMAYDSVAGVTVMYGGATPDRDLFDTWLWNGTSWSPVPSSDTGPRLTAPSLSDDPADGGVLLVGGSLSVTQPRCTLIIRCVGPGPPVAVQTWLFRGDRWQEVTGSVDQPLVPATLASLPNSSGIVAVADVTVRNCGTASGCPYTPAICVSAPTSVQCLDSIRVSTWFWSNKHWTAVRQVLDLDSGLALVPSVGDASLQLASLYEPPHSSCINADGGCPVIADPPRSWHWGTDGWVADPSTVILPPLQPGQAAVDGTRSVLLGADGHSWVLSDGAWSALQGSEPSTSRYGGALAADRNGRWVLFGGSDRPGGAGGDTWLLGDGGWHRV